MLKLKSNGDIQFKYVFDEVLLDTLGDERICHFRKAYELPELNIYGTFLQAFGAHPDKSYKYPLLVDKKGKLKKIDTLNSFVANGDYNRMSMTNTDYNELFISRGGYSVYHNYKNNYYSDTDFIPTQQFNYKESSMIYPSKDFGYYRIPDYFYCENNIPKYFIRYGDRMDSLWAHEYSDYLIWGIRFLHFRGTTSLRNGGFALIGEIGNDLFQTPWLIKTDANANCIWKTGFDETIFRNVAEKGLAEADDGGFVFFTWGKHNWSGATYDMFLVKTNPEGTLTNSTDLKPLEPITINPNPTNNYANISCSNPFTGLLIITGINGNILSEIKLTNITNYILDLSGYSAGIYLITMIDTAKKNKFTKQIIKQ